MASEHEGLVGVAMRSGYVFMLALTLAYLEVQIEGSNGWASALPTWRTQDPRWTWLAGGRPITGYHVALNLLLLMFFHWPFVLKRWTLRAEFIVLQAFVLLAVVWDYLWFVLNPAYGPARFFARDVWWYKSWAGWVPVEYWLGLLIAALFGCARWRHERDGGVLGVVVRIGIEVGVPVGLAAIATIVRGAWSR